MANEDINELISNSWSYREGGSMSLQTYSTTEQPIGKWINDKTLYRKVFNYSTDSTATTIPNSIINGTPVIISGSVRNGTDVFPLNYYVTSSDFFRAFYRSDGLQIRKGSSGNMEFNVIVEYYR